MSKPEQKTETLNLRVSLNLKKVLRLAAANEHRSMANMVEYLVLNYCAENNLQTSESSDPPSHQTSDPTN